jgi:hypothetical protein
MAHRNRPVPDKQAPIVLMQRVLSAPLIRREAVARGRALLASPWWCRTDEVAEQLARHTLAAGRRR